VKAPGKARAAILVAAALLLLAAGFVLFRRETADRWRAFEEWRTVSVLAHEGRYREAWDRMHPDFQARRPYPEFAAGFTNDWHQPNVFHIWVDAREKPPVPSLFKRSFDGRTLQFFIWNKRLWNPRWLEFDGDERDGCMIPEIIMKKDGDAWKFSDWCMHCR